MIKEKPVELPLKLFSLITSSKNPVTYPSPGITPKLKSACIFSIEPRRLYAFLLGLSSSSGLSVEKL